MRLAATCVAVAVRKAKVNFVFFSKAFPVVVVLNDGSLTRYCRLYRAGCEVCRVEVSEKLFV